MRSVLYTYNNSYPIPSLFLSAIIYILTIASPVIVKNLYIKSLSVPSMFIPISMYVWMYGSIYVCVYVYMYVCVFVCTMHVCMYECMDVYVCMYACIDIRMYVCVYICISLLAELSTKRYKEKIQQRKGKKINTVKCR